MGATIYDTEAAIPKATEQQISGGEHLVIGGQSIDNDNAASEGAFCGQAGQHTDAHGGGAALRHVQQINKRMSEGIRFIYIRY